MKAFLILEDGHVFKGTSIGSTRDVISEIVFNTSMTGYLEVMTDPSTSMLKYFEIRSINSADGVLSPRSIRPMVFVQYPVASASSSW